jgi:hypothetical protein
LYVSFGLASYCSFLIIICNDYKSPLATKPKSEIDDLFADADSEEDSDIFSSRKIIKKRTKESTVSDNTYSSANEELPKKFLDAVTPEIAGVATSTSETKVNFPNLFSDDENDDSDLFGNRKKQSSIFTSTPSSTTQELNRKVSCQYNLYVDVFRWIGDH